MEFIRPLLEGKRSDLRSDLTSQELSITPVNGFGHNLIRFGSNLLAKSAIPSTPTLISHDLRSILPLLHEQFLDSPNELDKRMSSKTMSSVFFGRYSVTTRVVEILHSPEEGRDDGYTYLDTRERLNGSETKYNIRYTDSRVVTRWVPTSKRCRCNFEQEA